MDIVTKKKLNILIQLAKADKEFAAVERDLIYKMAQDRNYPLKDVDELIDNPEPIGTLGALSERQKADYLLSSIELMLADHRVLESEVRFSQQIAIKLGYAKGVVDHLVANFGKKPLEDLHLSDYRLL